MRNINRLEIYRSVGIQLHIFNQSDCFRVLYACML